MTLDCTRIPVAELIPHSPPMVLLDHIAQYNSDSLVAVVNITPQSMFYDASVGGVPAWVGIEYMAQAIAALAGLRAKEKGEAVKTGLLLGTRRMLLPQKVLLGGNSYTICAKQLMWDPSGLANFECRICFGEQLCAEARINVFETDNIQKILAGQND